MMLLRWVVCSLVFGASVVHAQPAPEGPPVPPETENAMRGRDAAVGVKGGAAASAPSAAVSAPSAAVSSPSAAVSSPSAAVSPPLAAASSAPKASSRSASSRPTTAAAQPGPASSAGASTPAPAAAARDAASGPDDALRSFPPAPPPSDAPEPPSTALTSFAPAPAPPPGGAPPPAVEAASGKQDVTTASPPAAVSVSSDEDAEPERAPTGDERWSASALAGVGVTFDNTVAGVNPLGFGFGVRGDYRVLPSWSLGARMLYFVGGSVQLPASDVAMQSWLIAAEGAYVIELNKILIQPGIALGLHVREIDYRGFAGLVGAPEMLIPPDTTRLGLYVAPGVNLAVPLGLATPSLAPLIVGADFRLDLAFGKSVTSNVQLLVLAGFQF